MPGGKRPGAGRPKGAANKSTADIKVLAQEHTPAALSTLVSIMGVSESDAARVSAAKELLDRAYGKAAQSMSVEIGANERLLNLIEAGVTRAAQR